MTYCHILCFHIILTASVVYLILEHTRFKQMREDFFY